jgi:ATP-binding cassette subfamily C protein
MGAAWEQVFRTLADVLGALRPIKSLGVERLAQDAALSGFAALADARRRFTTSTAVRRLTLHLGGAALLAALVWFAVMVLGASPAVLLPLVALFARALPLLGGLQEAAQHWHHSQPAVLDVLGLIKRAEAARETAVAPGEPPRLIRELALDAVTVRFSAEEPAALDSATLALRAGSITALVGPSGAGKSTVADLLSGLAAPDSGAVLIDGVPMDEARRQAWRGAVAYVEQDPVLLAATLRENLRWADPAASEEALWQALAEAAADGFVRALPLGLDTPLGDGGRRLSGGERQRLMLARALLRRPQLLILDEATSALDAANEDAIAHAVGALRGRVTVLLIGHRGALLRLADQTIRLDGGRVVETI